MHIAPHTQISPNKHTHTQTVICNLIEENAQNINRECCTKTYIFFQ